MPPKNFKLIKNKALTHDVFELTFRSSEDLRHKAGQFITFLLPNGIWAKPYSILEGKEKKLKLIIKRVEAWLGGSKFICDSKVWDVLKWIWPVWNFTLQDNPKNKLFFWTWTWFVPLYNQIVQAIKTGESKLKLVFWVRTLKDLFYRDELVKLKQKTQKFSFHIFLSREKTSKYNYWRIGDFLSKKNIKDFEEFYICWNPLMVEDIEDKLLSLDVEKKDIFLEKY